jgi:hypothetical protein
MMFEHGNERPVVGRRAPIAKYLTPIILMSLVAVLTVQAVAGSGDTIWTWNQSDLSEFTGKLAGYSIESNDLNLMICSGHHAGNLYISATVPAWSRESNYLYSGVIQFDGLGSRAGVVLYYQDPDNLYQVNIQSGDTDPLQGGFRLRRFNNGVETQLIEDNTLHFASDTRYQFRLQVETYPDHTHFSLAVDDEGGENTLEFDDYSPARFTSGRVGLRKKQGPRACWDDLTVVATENPLATPTPAEGTPTASEIPPTVTSTSDGRATQPPNSSATATAARSATVTTQPATATHTPGGGRSTKTPTTAATASATAATVTATDGPGGRPTRTPSPLPPG